MRFVLWVHLLVWTIQFNSIQQPNKTQNWMRFLPNCFIYFDSPPSNFQQMHFTSNGYKVCIMATIQYSLTNLLLCTIFILDFLWIFVPFACAIPISKLWMNVTFLIALNETNWSMETLSNEHNNNEIKKEKKRNFNLLSFCLSACTTESLWLFPIYFEFQTFFCLNLSK